MESLRYTREGKVVASRGRGGASQQFYPAPGLMGTSSREASNLLGDQRPDTASGVGRKKTVWIMDDGRKGNRGRKNPIVKSRKNPLQYKGLWFKGSPKVHMAPVYLSLYAKS